MKTIIKNWNNQDIEITKSKSGVIATINPFENLVKTNIQPWPTPEVVQKLYKSEQQTAFENKNWELGYYADLQSINSEDAIVWSVFGTIAYYPKADQISFIRDIFRKINVIDSLSSCNIWLWRRIPHTETLVPGGPEIDFGIQTDDTIIFGEAKWKSKISNNQGIDKNKNQLQMREDFLLKYPNIFKMKNKICLTVCLDNSIKDNFQNNSFSSLLWKDILECSHPLKTELKEYYSWKCKNGNI